MNQTWTIFRKDCRHHWPEIVTSLAVLALFCYLEVRDWHRQSFAFDGGIFSWRFLYGMSVALVLISWMFLIVRIVQSESLVGDRQFWITRPYDWKQLLLAKVLFVLVFINVPLLVADIFLLVRAGFHPFAYIPGLLWMQVMWWFLLLLSTMALASVTATLAHMLLALLLVVLYMIGMIALSQAIPNADAPASDDWQGLLFIATAIAVVFLQYSYRKTILSRWLIVALCAVLTFGLVITPYVSLIAADYPLAKADSFLQLSLSDSSTADSSYVPFDDGLISIRMPLVLSAIPAGTFVKLNGMVVTLTNASGFHWDSGWKVQSDSLFPERKNVSLSFQVKSAILEKLKSTPFHAQVMLAFTVYRDMNLRQFVVPNGEFYLPGLGLCRTEARGLHELSCQVPMRRPRYFLVTADMSTSTCPLDAGGVRPQPGALAHASVEEEDSEPADMGISPIHESTLYLSTQEDLQGLLINPGVCPGTPLTLSDPVVVARKRIELQFDNLSLTESRQRGGNGQVILKP